MFLKILEIRSSYKHGGIINLCAMSKKKAGTSEIILFLPDLCLCVTLDLYGINSAPEVYEVIACIVARLVCRKMNMQLNI